MKPKLLAIALLAGCSSPAPPQAPGFEALLDIDRLESAKHFQGTWLEKSSGERLLVSYEPVAAYFRFVEKRVFVTGKTFMPEPYTQHVDATHLEVTSIRLADGEKPHDPEPKSLPPPALARTKAELTPRIGRWVEVQAVLQMAAKHDDDDWCDALLVLDDGTELASSMYLTELESKWKPLIGQRVTAMGKLKAEDGLKLIGPPAICAGEKRGCGMN
jgi:hypothetical protein